MLESLRNNFLNCFIIIIIFEAYSFFYINSFPVTPLIISMIFFIAILLIKLKYDSENNRILLTNFKNMYLIKQNYIVLVFMVYSILNYIIGSIKNFTSLILLIYFLAFFLVSHREITSRKFNRIIELFISIMTFLSIYAIYQVLARKYGFPLGDIIIENHMVKGFNWSNIIWLNGKMLWRSNAIFREPSFYSQFAALTCFLLGTKLFKKIEIKAILKFFINMIGLFFSFSGTGFIVLAVLIVLDFACNDNKLKKFIYYVSFFAGAIIILAVFFNLGSLYEYFIFRFSEITQNKMSGGMRFIGPFQLLEYSLRQHFFIGFGIGSRTIVKNSINSINITENIDSTIPRIGIELGIIGIVLWILFLYKLSRKRNFQNTYYFAFYVFLIVEMFNGELFLSSIYWGLIYFLNVTILSDNKKSDRNSREKSILYITPNNINESNGGGIGAKKIYLALKELDNYKVYVYSPSNVAESYFVSCKTKIKDILSRLLLHSNYMYIDWSYNKYKIYKLNPDIIILSNSRLGFMVDELKNNTNSIIITHFDNVEADYSKNYMDRYSGFKKYIYKFIEYNNVLRDEKKSVCNSDLLFILTQRDKVRISKLYKKNIDDKYVILPVCLSKNNKKYSFIESKIELNIVFLASLWYEPNSEGIIWFIENVWMPKYSEIDAKLIIGGKRPNENLLKYQNRYNIKIYPNFASLEDVVPENSIFISPIFDGAGMKVKVAEALSMGFPIIATDESLVGYEEALNDINNSVIIRANTPEEFEKSINKLFSENIVSLRDNAISLFNKYYSLDRVVKTMNDVLKELRRKDE